MFMTLRGVTLAALALTGAPALADEAWVMPDGSDAIYDSEFGDTAVFTYSEGRSRVRLYLPGLVGNFDNRGTYYGYWIADGRRGKCAADLTGVDGATSKSWGQAIITFDQPTFPSGWTASLGHCFDLPDRDIRANAIYGNQVVVPR